MIGLYLADLASPSGQPPALSVSTIDRRLSGLGWNHAQRGFTLDRKNRHIATVPAGIKRKHARPPVPKEAILAEDLLAMVDALPYALLLGYAGGLRRSESVSLDVQKDYTPGAGGWIESVDKGAVHYTYFQAIYLYWHIKLKIAPDQANLWTIANRQGQESAIPFIGYARVSTNDPSTAAQAEELRAAGRARVHQEQASASSPCATRSTPPAHRGTSPSRCWVSRPSWNAH